MAKEEKKPHNNVTKNMEALQSAMAEGVSSTRQPLQDGEYVMPIPVGEEAIRQGLTFREQKPVVEVMEIACVRRNGAYAVEVRRTVNGKPEAEVVRSSTDKRIAADKALAAILEAWR